MKNTINNNESIGETLSGFVVIIIIALIAYNFASNKIESMEAKYFPVDGLTDMMQVYNTIEPQYQEKIECTNYYLFKHVSSFKKLLLGTFGNEYTQFAIDTAIRGGKIVKRADKRNREIAKEAKRDIRTFEQMKLQGVGQLDLMIKANNIVDKFKATCDRPALPDLDIPELRRERKQIEVCHTQADELFEKLRYQSMSRYQ